MREVFLSYHHEDRKIAAEVKGELEKSGFSAFLAHDDIEVSKIWREEILKHLASCSALIAIVTEHFASSFWVNQEVGVVMAKQKPIVSLIFAGSRALPGFLEMFQGISVSRISVAVAKSLETIANSPDSSDATREKGIQKSKEILGSKKLVFPFPVEIAGIPEFPNWLTTQVIVIPSSITRSLIDFTKETDSFLRRLPKGHMEFEGESPKQNGIEWYSKSDDSECFAEVTHEGLFQYKQAKKRDDTLYFPRVIQLIFDAANFATAMYKEFGFAGSVIVSLVVDGTKNRHLVGERWHNIRSTDISTTGLVAVQKEIDLDQLALEPIALVARMFLDFARAFKWSMGKDEATQIAQSCL